MEDYIPNKYTLIGILLALKLSLNEINSYLLVLTNNKLDENILEDKIISEQIRNKVSNIVLINKVLFINRCKQIGSENEFINDSKECFYYNM